VTGSGAVDRSADIGRMAQSNAPAPMVVMPQATQAAADSIGVPGDADGTLDSSEALKPFNPIQTIGDKTFLQLNGVWTDTTFEPDTMTTEKVAFLSDEYFALLDTHPELAEYFAVGERVIV